MPSPIIVSTAAATSRVGTSGQRWITACGLEDAQFTSMAAELGRPVTVENVRPAAASAIAEVFGLELESLPAEGGLGLWPQPVHEKLAVR